MLHSQYVTTRECSPPQIPLSGIKHLSVTGTLPKLGNIMNRSLQTTHSRKTSSQWPFLAFVCSGAQCPRHTGASKPRASQTFLRTPPRLITPLAKPIAILIAGSMFAVACGSGATDAIDAGCSTDYSRALEVPIEFAVLLKVCETPDGRAGSIENLTNGVIAITVASGASPVLFVGIGQSTPEYEFTSYATLLGQDGRGGYRLGPKSTVVASADVPGGPQLMVEMDGLASVQAMTVTALVGSFKDSFSTPGQHMDAGVACVEGASSLYEGAQGRIEDFINGLIDVTACKNLLNMLDDQSRSTVRAEVALGKYSDNLRPLWDEIAKVIGLVMKFRK